MTHSLPRRRVVHCTTALPGALSTHALLAVSNLLLHHLAVKRSRSTPRQRFTRDQVGFSNIFPVTFLSKDERALINLSSVCCALVRLCVHALISSAEPSFRRLLNWFT